MSEVRTVDNTLVFHKPVEPTNFAMKEIPFRLLPISRPLNGEFIPDISSNVKIDFNLPSKPIDVTTSVAYFPIRMYIPYNLAATPTDPHTTPLGNLIPYFNDVMQMFRAVTYSDGSNYVNRVEYSDVVSRISSLFPETEYLQTMRSNIPAVSRHYTFNQIEDSNTKTFDPDTVAYNNTSLAAFENVEFDGWKIEQLATAVTAGIKYYDLLFSTHLYNLHPIFQSGQIYPGHVIGSSIATLSLEMNRLQEFFSFEQSTGTLVEKDTIYPADPIDGFRWSVINPYIQLNQLSADSEMARLLLNDMLNRAQTNDISTSGKRIPGLPLQVERIISKPVNVVSGAVNVSIQTGLVHKSIRTLYYVFKKEWSGINESGLENTIFTNCIKTRTLNNLTPQRLEYIPIKAFDVKIGGKSIKVNPETNTLRLYNDLMRVMKKPANLITGASSDVQLGDLPNESGFGTDCFIIAVDLTDPSLPPDSVNSGLNTTGTNNLEVEIQFDNNYSFEPKTKLIQIAVVDESLSFINIGGTGSVYSNIIDSPNRDP